MSHWTLHDWTDLAAVRRALAAGADPDRNPTGYVPPLHSAACWGSAEVLAELLTVAREVDQPDWAGRTALWYAVREWDREKVAALIAAGADPWRRRPDGRCPGELAWWAPVADQVAGLPGAVEPTEEERAAQRAADALIASFDTDDDYQDWGCVAFVADRTAAELVAALGGEEVPVEDDEEALEEGLLLVHDLPGGAVLQQYDGIEIHGEEVLGLLSRGTVAVSVFDHPDAFICPSVSRDGVLGPCEEVMRDPEKDDPPETWRYRFGDGGHPSGWTARALAMAVALTGVDVDGGAKWPGPGGRAVRLPVELRD
ncbi:ankyrin repeat domain-containing protein [Streptomyces sp. NA02950]|uniref:ankyrin repeat domain-containing protein n=1 Tax=Streptomyces sp. NA02950 TaxID=2742137 RepID=UPI001591AA85|nr:ankyrin repeat domain-containing protein [Streptomyces sp. NA02950]QKV91342.1 ankyrin repeat domain-containing protein [Streptomyces sp. NA02950]